MLSCLGIFVDNNLIKYAKLKRNKKTYSVESFGIEVYDDIEKTINRIIEETNSENIPICTNISNEVYSYFDVYAELDKNDIEKSLQIEFDKLCSDNGLNSDDFISKYTLNFHDEDEEKLRATYISIAKEYLESYLKIFKGHKLNSVIPLGMAITNLIEDRAENAIIVNLEENSEAIFYFNKSISSVEDIRYSLREALLKINEEEMSYKKSIETLKTVNLFNYEDSKYSNIIIPLMDNICDEINKLADEYDDPIKRVYITGTGAIINNIDMYFQDKLNIKCEVLKPFFCNVNSSNDPIKEYVEVNSAIALAIDGLKNVNKDVNFAQRTKLEELEIDTKITAQEDFEVSDWKEMIKEPLTIDERLFLRIIIFEILFLLIYGMFSGNTLKKLNAKGTEIKENIAKTSEQIRKINEDSDTISKYSLAYEKGIGLDTTSNSENGKITNMLVNIMYVIPTRVQLTSIKQIDKEWVEITAESDNAEDIDTFAKSIESEGVLSEVQKNKTGTGTIKLVLKGKFGK
ncbi:MAG: hypothetical protein K6D97_06035 [Clostridia bacterium]|nr:hypothetical protein [Clostridia bacterium]